MSYTKITCPNCFDKHDADDLAENSDYGHWSSEEVDVRCPTCEFRFTVRCDHAGYDANEDFDMNGFRRAHKIQYPEGCSRVFVDHYLQSYIEDGIAPKMFQDPDDRYDQNKSWAEAHGIAAKIWDGIQAAKGSLDDEQDQEG